MKNVKKALLISACLSGCLVLVLSLGGCTGIIAQKALEQAIEKSVSGEADVDIDLNDGEMVITDEEGNEMSIGGAELPSDWPSVVPVSNDIDIQSTFSQTTDGKKGWTVMGNIKGSSQAMYEYYKQELSGWEEKSDFVSDQGDDGKTFSYQVSNDSYLVTVWIFEDDSESTITLSVNEQ